MTTSNITNWNNWNEAGKGPKYPHEKVVQYCFRNYSPDNRKIHVLDLGCGGGVHTVFLASEGFLVTGVDISDVGIAITEQKLKSLNLYSGLHVTSIDDLKFPAHSFELVISVGVFDSAGLQSSRRSVEQLSKLLRFGGRGLFVFASDRDFRIKGQNPMNLHGYSRKEVNYVFNKKLFSQVYIDRYITTYLGGKIEQNDWIVTVEL